MAEYSHFVAKLAPDGGPDPADELRRILDESRKATDSIGWFPTLNMANDFIRAGNSICIIMHTVEGSDELHAVLAHIARAEGKKLPSARPGSEEARCYYSRWADRLDNWWPLGGKLPSGAVPLVGTTFASLTDIPGWASGTGNRAAQVFKGQAAFAGWRFPDDFNTLLWIEKLRGR